MSLRLARVGLALLLCTAAARAPAGFWTGPASAPVPDDIAGGSVIHTEALAALLKTGRVILVDVAAAAKRPPNLPAGRIWMPLPHRDIPGSIWIPGVGDGFIGAAADAEFRRGGSQGGGISDARLLKLTRGRMDAPLVRLLPCMHGWLSWNAAI